MLILVTGQPGNGKTLYTLGLVEKLRAETGREVYHAQGGKPGEGIPELKLPWKVLENPERWYDLPNGSIVVIDECQHVFRVRKTGAEVPKHVSEFETHRHRGFDVYLITQHPQLLDIAVRKLTGRHYHVVRTFGQDRATVRQWERAVDPNDRSVKGEALVHAFPFPKERFGWYKSSDMHTVRKELPWKKFAVFGGSVLGAVAAIVWAFGSLAERYGGSSDEPPSVVSAPSSGASEPYIPVVVPDRWHPAAFTPRAAPLPWSAPRYDVIVQEASAPRVIGCMHMRIGNRHECRCADQQGNEAPVDHRQCLDYVRRGVFDSTRPDFDPKAENIKRLEARDAMSNQAPGMDEPQQAPQAAKPPSAAGASTILGGA